MLMKLKRIGNLLINNQHAEICRLLYAISLTTNFTDLTTDYPKSPLNISQALNSGQARSEFP